jgi:hypothetical protein
MNMCYFMLEGLDNDWILVIYSSDFFFKICVPETICYGLNL